MVAGATNYGIPRGHRLPCVRGRYSFKVQCRCTAVCCGNSLYTVGKYLINCVSGISTVRKVFILCKVFIRYAAVTLLTHRVTLPLPTFKIFNYIWSNFKFLVSRKICIHKKNPKIKKIFLFWLLKYAFSRIVKTFRLTKRKRFSSLCFFLSMWYWGTKACSLSFRL